MLPFTIAPPLPHLREYSEEDAPEVARFWRECWSVWPGGAPGGGDLATPEGTRRDMAGWNTRAALLAFAPDPESGGERVVGFLTLTDFPTETSVGYVNVLGVHPAWLGRGVGRDLLMAALERSVANGDRRLDLHTWPGNARAVPLYKKSGYFWQPDTSVHMLNFLPLLFQIEAVRAFFRDDTSRRLPGWYRYLKRELTVGPDEERWRGHEVYTYLWERDGRCLRALIDRHANALVSLETDHLSAAAWLDDRRVPVGGSRLVSWRVENRTSRAVQATVFAEGVDGAESTLRAADSVEVARTWEQPVVGRRVGDAKVRGTVMLDGQSVDLTASVEVVAAVSAHLESGLWLTPGVPRPTWLTLENGLEEPVRGVLRLSCGPDLEAVPASFEFELAPRERAACSVALTASRAGVHRLNGEAMLEGGGAVSALDAVVFAGIPGELLIDQRLDEIIIASERLIVKAPLKPDWFLKVDVADRATGREVGGHGSLFGPPYFPPRFSGARWTPRVERTGDGVRLTLSARPDETAGLLLERVVDVGPTGLLRFVYRATNAGAQPMALCVDSFTRATLDGAEVTWIAAPLADGLLVDDAPDVADWGQPDASSPERFGEGWLARYGDNQMVATLWSSTETVSASWDLPGLLLSLGTLDPGQTAETPPVYVYFGPGDWRTARALWRQLIAPDAPAEDPVPRRALALALEPFAFAHDSGLARLALSSARARPYAGQVVLQVGGREVAAEHVAGLRFDRPAHVETRLDLPATAGALPAVLAFNHERGEARRSAAVLRLGDAATRVSIGVDRDAAGEVVRLENDRLRLTLSPAWMARGVALEVRGPNGRWNNHLAAKYPETGLLPRYNPWLGGIYPDLQVASVPLYPGRLGRETFVWREVERQGCQGIPWRGVAMSAEPQSRELAGLALEVAYLTLGASNVVAVAARLENRSRAPREVALALETAPAPGGVPGTATLWIDRDGPRARKRVHSSTMLASGQWAAMGALEDAPIVAVVAAARTALRVHDMGLDGAVLSGVRRVTLAPGEAIDSVLYVVVVDDPGPGSGSTLEHAWLYRFLGEVPGLV